MIKRKGAITGAAAVLVAGALFAAGSRYGSRQVGAVPAGEGAIHAQPAGAGQASPDEAAAGTSVERAPAHPGSSDAVEAAKAKARFLADDAKWLGISVAYQEQRPTSVGPLPVRIGRRERGTSNPRGEGNEVLEIPDNHPNKAWVSGALDTLHFYTPVYDESLAEKFGLPNDNPLSYLELRERVSVRKL